MPLLDINVSTTNKEKKRKLYNPTAGLQPCDATGLVKELKRTSPNCLMLPYPVADEESPEEVSTEIAIRDA